MIQAILFDFDGVLTLDATGSLSICTYLAQATGRTYEEIFKAYRPLNPGLLYGQHTHAQIWPDFCASLGQAVDPALLLEAFLHTPIDWAMIRLAQGLRQAGYILGMITDNKTDRMEAVIRHHGWKDLFDPVIVSDKIGSGKDHAPIFEKTLKRLSQPAEACIFIDNSPKNLIIPQHMGIHALYFDDKRRDHAALRQSLTSLGVILPPGESSSRNG